MTASLAVDLAAAIRGAAKVAQACVVESFPEPADRAPIPLVIVDQEDAVRLISAVRPKVVYLMEVAFDAEEEMAAAAEALSALGLHKVPLPLAAASRRVTGHAGEVRTTLAGFMVDGVLHASSASAEWHDAFDKVVDETLALATDDAQSRGRVEASAASADIVAKAAVLAGHPSFNFGRVSFEKRQTLAAAIFPECDVHTIREVTRYAENLFWLEESGFKPLD